MPLSCKRHFREYCKNCTFAGFALIADDTKHWTERWFWVALVVLSWYGSGLLVQSAWTAFVSNPISFGVETTYTDWDTKMPAVYICETSNDNRIYDVADTIWTPDHLLDLEDVMKDIVYFRGAAFNLVNVCVQSKNPDPKCPFSNYSYYVNLVRSTCPELLINCLFDKKEFDCCKYFVPIHTDMGTCFALNSVQVKNPILYPMVFNVTQKEGVLKFETLLNTMLYTLGEDEVPTVTTLTSSTLKLMLGKNYQRQVVVKNIENDPLTVETTPAQRACRFSYENDNGLYPLYSYSTCTVLCRKREQMKLCGCTDHFMIGSDESKMCNASGLLCLHRHFSQLTTLKPRWAGRRPGLVCDCLPSCDETEITIIKDAVTSAGRARKKRIAVELKMAYLPTERFKRNVVRSRLDLVGKTSTCELQHVNGNLKTVSIGGAAGLFVGASLLSFVELVFFFTIRLLDNIYLEKRKKKERTSVRNMKTFQPAMPRNTRRFYSQRSNLITFRS